MGNSSGKESSPDSAQPHSHRRSSNTSPSSGPSGPASAVTFLEPGTSSDAHLAQGGHSTGRRGSTHDFSFLGLGGGGGSSDRDAATEARRETRAEKEARKLEKERAARVKERETSMKEEHVDGGFLVTMGTYTASEDFNKAVIRQLIIERRIAPFWRGLDDFSSSWTEHQLVAAARDLPIPAPDEIPAELRDRSPQSSIENIKLLHPDGSSAAASSSQYSLPLHSSNSNNNKNTDASSTYTSSHPAFSSSLQPSSASPSTASPLFRGRAKTLASLTTFRTNSHTDMMPQEVQLPKNPYVNGQPIEVFLYKNATECPICFLYFPPYFNKSRCCDQPICSECFVQIKRPEPHQPENLNPGEESQGTAEDAMLVSEPAQCPFCTEPEFGVTYDPPPFRRGLTYVNQASNSGYGHNKNAIASMMSATSSSSSIASHQAPGSQSAAAGVGRRRAVSLSANAPTVIATDRIRPDWAKKLADARAQAMRRSAAATALHNAAYLLNGAGGESRGFILGRRRRAHFAGEGLGGSSTGVGSDGGDGSSRVPEGMTPEGIIALLSGATDRRMGGASGGTGSGRAGIDGNDDLFPGRTSSRRTRVEELEEMMMMEAIRQSLQAEEDRKQTEDKEASKAVKKEEKKRAKEAKKAEKAAKKRGDRDGSGSNNKLYKSNTTSSSSFTNNSVNSGPSHTSTNNNPSSSSYHGAGGNGSFGLDGAAVTSHDRMATTSGLGASEVIRTTASGTKGKQPDRIGFATSKSSTPSAANAGKLVSGQSQQNIGPAEGASTATTTSKDQKDQTKSTAITQSSSSSISSSNLTSSGSSSSTTTTPSPLRSRSRSRSGSGSGFGSHSGLAFAMSPTAQSLAPRTSAASTVKLAPASSTSKSTSASTSTSVPTADLGAERNGTTSKDMGYSGDSGRTRGGESGNSSSGSGSGSKQSTELSLTGFQSLAAMIEAGMPSASASASVPPPSSSSATGQP